MGEKQVISSSVCVSGHLIETQIHRWNKEQSIENKEEAVLVIPPSGKQRLEEQEFEARLSYIESLKPAWTT